MSTLALLTEHGAEEVKGRFRLAGVEIASRAFIGDDGEAYLNGLKPTAYAQVGGFWKAQWLRAARSREAKEKLRAFFAAFEKMHGIRAGRSAQ